MVKIGVEEEREKSTSKQLLSVFRGANSMSLPKGRTVDCNAICGIQNKLMNAGVAVW